MNRKGKNEAAFVFVAFITGRTSLKPGTVTMTMNKLAPSTKAPCSRNSEISRTSQHLRARAKRTLFWHAPKINSQESRFTCDPIPLPSDASAMSDASSLWSEDSGEQQWKEETHPCSLQNGFPSQLHILIPGALPSNPGLRETQAPAQNKFPGNF